MTSAASTATSGRREPPSIAADFSGLPRGSATSVANRVATSQIALPKAACDAAYASAGYQSSITNLSRVSLASDMVFSDGSALAIAIVTGSVAEGFTSALTVAI